MDNNESLNTIQYNAFKVITYISLFLYIVVALGLSLNAPQYLNNLQYYTKIYISLFLLYRFNPFRRVKFTNLDSTIAFSAGLFLLTTTAFGKFLETYIAGDIENIGKNNLMNII
jgi:hypothetical protein